MVAQISSNITNSVLKAEDYFPPIFTTFYHVPVVITCYLVWVTKFGPKMMSSRKPLGLKRLIMAYNMIQVIINLYILKLAFQTWGLGVLQVWNNVCNPIEATIGYDEPNQYEYMKIIYYFYLTKILDLMDTVFFVLRKKQSQVTFLHLFHHTTMVFSMWMTLVLIREQIGALFGVLNTFIHTIMYSYYFLSSFGPSVQKYLWWKKHLTKVQMVQFVIMLAALVKIKIINCKCNPLFWVMWSANISTYFVLFLHFYLTSYKKKKLV